MAESSLASDSSVKQVNDVLDLLGTGVRRNKVTRGNLEQNFSLASYSETDIVRNTLRGSI